MGVEREERPEVAALSEQLRHIVERVWRSETAQGRLLDLGERKQWPPDGAAAAYASLATWLRDTLGLRASSTFDPAPSSVGADDLRACAEALLDRVNAEPGVSAALVAIAPALGVTPKTLSNSLSMGVDSTRSSHRWLLLLHRLRCGWDSGGAWVYHQRTPHTVSIELGRRSRVEAVDAADALLVFSLIALWQRRRPQDEVRSNRGRVPPRRETPKPIVSLIDPLVTLGQVEHLCALAERMEAPAGTALTELVIECALTHAHLGPHIGRRGEKPRTAEDWLQAVERVLESRGKRLGAHTCALLRLRIELQRAYRDKRPVDRSRASGVSHPYADAVWLLQDHRERGGAVGAVDPMAPGVMMLLPSLLGKVSLMS